jgi:hypothetical protein
MAKKERAVCLFSLLPILFNWNFKIKDLLECKMHWSENRSNNIKKDR